jgi:hypothetical protein
VEYYWIRVVRLGEQDGPLEPGQPGPASSTPSGLRSVSGCEIEHFGMGPAVVLGQDFTESTGTVRDGAVADLAAGDRQMGNGHGETARR